MTEIKYGWREGLGKGKEYPCAATQYVHRRGGHFVNLVAGDVTLCASGAITVAGWAEVPKDTTGYDVWLSAAGDNVFVVNGLEDVYEMPVNEGNASLAASYVGQGAGIVNSNATYTTIQKAKIGGSLTASPLSIVDVDVTNKTVFVKIKPKSKQAT